MHDLRRQALESRKTVSRKAQSKQSSRNSSQPASRSNSRANSRATSRATSRQGSDEEDERLSDETSLSINSIDEVLSGEDGDLQAAGWKADLDDALQQLLERKRSSSAGREKTLQALIRMLSSRYAAEEIRSKTEAVVSGLLKSVKSNSSERESVFALKALALVLITDPADDAYDVIHQPLKRAMNEAESLTVKAAAIQTLAAAAFFGGLVDDEVLSLMDYLLEIAETDGHSIEAGDSISVVTAALEGWGLLATQVEDLEQRSRTALEIFVDQLDSSEAPVQIAAGENIALAYEKSFTEREEDEEDPDPDGFLGAGHATDSDPEDETPRNGPKMVQRYQPYDNVERLKQQLSALASTSSRRISKKEKKSLHSNFADILHSVENPTRGPRYQKAVSQETGKRYGSRMVVRLHQTGVMKIDKWWKLHRLQSLRRILGAGFMAHYEHNAVVFESLP
ncbi:MAG: hypothetical protein M1826_006403 [Phylliscum demangeonii]|nr:MAG: hypothetical protein M1826_006403 [Phylliscum demangeonii]